MQTLQFSMSSIVEQVANCEIDQNQIDNNIRYKRIYLCFLEMKEKRFTTITYHGKMLESDVIQLESIRKHYRKKLKIMKSRQTEQKHNVQVIKGLQING